VFSTTKLQNNLTILQAPIEGANSVTVLVMVPVGSRYETGKTSGAAHFLEHMMFKGTKKRPKAMDISRTLDSVGAEFNAFTSKEYTGYYVKVSKNFAERAVDLLSDMLFESKLASEDFERERGVIIEEIRMYEDTPMRHVYDLADESMFPGQRLGRNIAGSEESVGKMKLTDLREFWGRHYQPDNMVMVVSGATDGFIDVVNKYFGDRKNGKECSRDFQKIKKVSKRTPILQTKETDQAHVILSFPSLPYNRLGESSTNLLRTILGGTMSSRLFTEVREKRGLAYAVSANVDRYRDTGNFQIYAGLDRTRLQEALKVIANEVKKITTKGITKQELKEAKSNVRGRMTLKMEDTTELAAWYARGHLFYPDAWEPEKYLRRVESRTVEQVNKIAKQILQVDQMGVACIGPYEEVEFGSMLKRAFES